MRAAIACLLAATLLCPALLAQDLPEIKISTYGWDESCGTDQLPPFTDPAIAPNIHLEGNWVLREYEDGRLIGVIHVSLHKSQGLVLSVFFIPSRADRLNEPWRVMWGYGWRIDEHGTKNELNPVGDNPFGIEPDGTVTLVHGDKVVVTLHPDGHGSMSGEWKEDNNWTDTHRQGTATAQKVTPKIESVTFIGDKTDTVAFGEGPGTLEFAYQGPQYGRMRGNRRRVSIQMLGENLWGCHRLWLDPIHHLEINGGAVTGEPTFPDGVRDPVKGASIGIITWPEMFPGRKTLWLDDIPIRFELVLNDYPEANLPLAERINAAIEEAAQRERVDVRYVRRTDDGYEPLETLPFYMPIYVELAFEQEPEQLQRDVVVQVEGETLTLATRRVSATVFRSALPFWLQPEQEAVLVQP